MLHVRLSAAGLPDPPPPGKPDAPRYFAAACWAGGPGTTEVSVRLRRTLPEAYSEARYWEQLTEGGPRLVLYGEWHRGGGDHVVPMSGSTQGRNEAKKLDQPGLVGILTDAVARAVSHAGPLWAPMRDN